MYLKTLSKAVLLLCEAHKLNYESAAERCRISAKCYRSIIKQDSIPSILDLEKICNGFQLTPNDLLIPPIIQRELSFRTPMTVTHVHKVPYLSGFTTYPICPRCEMTFEREYQPFCDHCGQRLHWKGFSKAIIGFSKKQK